MKSLLLESPRATIRFHDLAGAGAPLVFVHGLVCALSCDYPAIARDPARSGNHIWAGSMAATAPLAAHRAAVSLVEGASPSWRRQLLALDVPRTVLFGARSLPDPDAESLPASGVGVAVVPDARHSMAWDNPSGLARAIAEACQMPNERW